MGYTPSELIKSRLQNQALRDEKLYRGPIHCLLKTASDEGVSTLFRGYNTALGMRLVGAPAWFLSYECTKRYLSDNGREPLTTSMTLMSGTVAGLSLSLSFFCFVSSSEKNLCSKSTHTHSQASSFGLLATL